MRGWLSRSIARVLAGFKAGRLDRDLEEELESHLAMLVSDNVRRGMRPEDARRLALIRLGRPEPLKALHREARGLPAVESLLQDLRYGFRSLRRDAAFSLFAILIAGLGIGATATVFTVVNALLLRPLPFRDPDRLVWIANGFDDGLSGATVQAGYFLDYREQNRSFVDLAAFYAFYGVGDSTLTGNGVPERLSGVPVSQRFFALLGIQPQLGRVFTEDECATNGPHVVILSHGLWQRRFAADAGIVGRQLTLNDEPVTVVGVLPATFDFAMVFAPGSRIDLYFPLALDQGLHRQGNTLSIIGRLAPGVTPPAAQEEASELGKRLEGQHRNWNGFRPRLMTLDERVSGRVRPALFVLMSAVGAVMLIVCANLSNLLLARTTTRQKEMAIRAALGAGRRRLVRQLLTESVVLSGCGAVLGVALALAGTHVLSRLEAFSIPLLASVRFDVTALGFIVLVAMLTGILFGLVPAIQVPAVAVHDPLKEGGRGSTGGRRHAWTRGVLVVAEVAFACVLLVAAGLLIRSFLRVLDVDLGFHPEHAAALRIDPSRPAATQDLRNAYFNEALRRARSIPGVERAGLTDVLPLGRNRSWGVQAKGRIYTREDAGPDAFVRVVSDGYLGAMGIPLRAGRDFTEHDTPSAPRVILVNETLAHIFWPRKDPIGQIMSADGDRYVVGVVADVRHLALEQAAGPEMYIPIRQSNDYPSVDLVVRTSLPPADLAAAVRAALAPIDPDLPANEFRTVQQLVDKAISPRRFVVFLLAGFSAFALVLACLGIYAVISYSVNYRRQELGIRLALGASARGLQARIVLNTVRLAGLGLLVGVPASWLLAQMLRGLLFGITATDPVTLFGMPAILLAVAILAGYLPARRASRIDPMTALREG